jgi:hypothetical protein
MPLAVALNAQPPYTTVGQKKAVGRAVGIMTDVASLDLHGLVLENKGSSFLRVALETHIHVEFVPSSQTGPGPGSVGGVAVRAKHGALRNRVPRREIKPGLDFRVAGKAKRALFALEELGLQRGSVHAVTLIAPHGPCLVAASFELEEIFLMLVAFQAEV